MPAMKGLLEELDYCECPLGKIILRRRKVLSLDGEIVYDVILNEEFLMSMYLAGGTLER